MSGVKYLFSPSVGGVPQARDDSFEIKQGEVVGIPSAALTFGKHWPQWGGIETHLAEREVCLLN